jgi:hypothetical protein
MFHPVNLVWSVYISGLQNNSKFSMGHSGFLGVGSFVGGLLKCDVNSNVDYVFCLTLLSTSVLYRYIKDWVLWNFDCCMHTHVGCTFSLGEV